MISTEHIPQDKNTTISIALPICAPTTMNTLIKQATALGCSQIIPIVYEYSKSTGAHKRLGAQVFSKWRAVMIGACEQSERAYLPKITQPNSLQQLLYEQIFSSLIHLGFGPSTAMNDLIRLTHDHSLCVFLGPEGGMTTAEVKLLVDCGSHNLCLSDGVLRVETACGAGLGLLSWLAANAE